jgi:hypothetical protein
VNRSPRKSYASSSSRVPWWHDHDKVMRTFVTSALIAVGVCAMAVSSNERVQGWDMGIVNTAALPWLGGRRR